MLEPWWIAVQIGAVLVGGYWTYDTWIKDDRAQLIPHFVANASVVSSTWGNSNKDACKISTVWMLKNTGKSPIDVKGITVKVWSIEDNYKFNFEGSLKDYSIGALELDEKGSLSLSDGTDRIQSQGNISRSIDIAFKPSSNNEEWFSKNRILLEIIASVENGDIENSSDKSIYKSALNYACYNPNKS